LTATSSGNSAVRLPPEGRTTVTERSDIFSPFDWRLGLSLIKGDGL
jgi:hypothetical protein